MAEVFILLNSKESHVSSSPIAVPKQYPDHRRLFFVGIVREQLREFQFDEQNRDLAPVTGWIGPV
jgi:hypothetical protein